MSDELDWDDYVDSVGSSHSQELQQLVVALHRFPFEHHRKKHVVRDHVYNTKFRHQIIEHGHEVARTMLASTGVARFDWGWYLEWLKEAGKDHVMKAVEELSIHQARVDGMSEDKLFMVVIDGVKRHGDGQPLLRERLGMRHDAKKIPYHVPLTMVRRLIYLVSDEELSEVLDRGGGRRLYTVAQHSTAGELQRSVQEALCRELDQRAAARVRQTASWAVLQPLLATASIYRVRERGACRPGQSAVLDGNDETRESDLVCGADATAALSHIRGLVRDDKVSFVGLRLGMPLETCARRILEAASFPPVRLVSAVADAVDTLDGKRVREALESVASRGREAAETHDRRGTRAVATCCTLKHLYVLEQFGKKFHLDVYRTFGSYMQVRARSRSIHARRFTPFSAPQYSDVAAAAAPLSAVKAAPRSRLAVDLSGYVLARHDETGAQRRLAGQCAAEALAFAAGDEGIGDAVAAAIPPVPRVWAPDDPDEQAFAGIRLHDIDIAITPYHRRL